MKILVIRAYEKPSEGDGRRILVDRLWPRGLSKETARIDFWAREIAPSTQLRRWYGHDPRKWPEFKSRYFGELDVNPGALKDLLRWVRMGAVAFVYSSREEHLNNAVALKEYLESLISSCPR